MFPYVSSAGPAPNEVEFVELYAKENAKVHHTINYEIVDNIKPALVLRRGDPFYIGVRLNRPYDQYRDKIRLEFMFGMFSCCFRVVFMFSCQVLLK